MVESTEEKVISEIKRLIRQHTYCSYRDEEECFVTEIYADYRTRPGQIPLFNGAGGKPVGRLLGIAWTSGIGSRYGTKRTT